MSFASEDFADIAKRHGSDKFIVHSYQRIYERFLQPRRYEPIKLLEIGIGGEKNELGGPSLKTWRDYMPNASIVGIDIYDKSALDGDRIRTFICDQSNPAALRKLSEDHGPFDVVIDDGSHMGSHVAMSFFTLFPLLAPGGSYIIEDIQTSYWPHYGGSSVASNLYDTAIRWIKLAVDIVNRSEALDPALFPFSLPFPISELHVFHNIAVFCRDPEQTDTQSNILNEEMRLSFLQEDQARHQDIMEIYQSLLIDPGKMRSLLQIVARQGGLDAFLQSNL